MSYEKKSFLLPAALGAGTGALLSEDGERGQGAIHGAATGVGTDLGGFGGMAAGGALGSLIAPGPGTLAGMAAGLPIGMYGGFKGSNALQRKLTGGPLPYDSDHKSKKNKSKKPKDGDGDGKVNDGTSEEKEASIQSIVNAGKAGLSQLGQKIKLPAAGMAGLGLGGLAGNEVGKRTGERTGDAAGYARGSGEGGNQAMQDLFNGLIDMRRRGSKMKSKDMPFIHTGTNPYGPAAERAALESLYKESSSCTSGHRAKKKKKKVKKAALEIVTKVAAYRRIHEKQARAVRIKLASHVLRMHHLRQELETYDPYQLSKSAAIGAHKADRMKAAALVRQIELEKQAFLGGIVRGVVGGLGRAAGRGIASAANMAGRGISGASKGMVQGARGGGGLMGAARGAANEGAKGVVRGIKTDPLAGTALLGGGAMAAGAGLQNAMRQPMQQGQQMLAQGLQQGQQTLAQGQQQVGEAVAQAPQAVGNYFGNLGNAFMGR